MKKLSAALVGLLLLVPLAHGGEPLDMVGLRVKAWTGTVSTVREDTTSYNCYGYVDQIDIIFEDSLTTCRVQVVTATNDWYDIETVLLDTTTNINVSQAYRPRFVGHTAAGYSTNTVERYLLYGEKLKLRAWNSTFTNKDVSVRVKLNDK